MVVVSCSDDDDEDGQLWPSSMVSVACLVGVPYDLYDTHRIRMTLTAKG